MLQAAATHFGLNLQLTGEVQTPEQLSCVASLTTEVLGRLAAAGIAIRTCDSALSVVDPRDLVARVIALVYGRTQKRHSVLGLRRCKTKQISTFLPDERRTQARPLQLR